MNKNFFIYKISKFEKKFQKINFVLQQYISLKINLFKVKKKMKKMKYYFFN